MQKLIHIAAILLSGQCLAPLSLADDSSQKPEFLLHPSQADSDAIKAQEDWSAIMQALHSAEAGDTVQLASGTFFLHKSIIVEGFDGALRGAGPNKTVIKTAPDSIFDISENPVGSYVDGFTIKQPAMILFSQPVDSVERTVVVSHLGIMADQVSTGWFRGYPSNLEDDLNSVGGIAVGNESLSTEHLINLNVEFDSLSVQCVEGAQFRSPNNTNYSCAYGVSADGGATGYVLVRDIHVEKSTVGAGLFLWVGEGSQVAVMDSHFKNTFIGLYADGWDNLTVVDNTVAVNRRVGMALWNSPPYLPMGFVNSGGWVAENKLIDGSFAGMFLDRGEGLVVKENLFQRMTPGLAVIFAIRQTGSLLKENRFVDTGSGAGPDVLVAVSEDVRILENNHKASGLRGWTGDPLNGSCEGGPGAIHVLSSIATVVRDEKYPKSKDTGQMLCDQGLGTQY